MLYVSIGILQQICLSMQRRIFGHMRTVKAQISLRIRTADCANAQADLDLHCPHMPDDTSLHGKGHLSLLSLVTVNRKDFL